MRVVLDPNVLVSAALSPGGPPAQLVRRWLDGEFELVASAALLAELERVLDYPKLAKRIPRGDAAALVALIRDEAHIEDDPPQGTDLAIEDAGDEYLVALALSCGAPLVSGDKHLLVLGPNLPVYAPSDFVRWLDGR